MAELKIFHSITEIPLTAWRKLEDPNSPFQDYEFHQSLEDSGVVGENVGQKPIYITLWENGLVAAAVIYVKSHSYGEYIFDWQWANAAQEAGIRYYPKLVMAQPFTPASANKLLAIDAHWREALLVQINEVWRQSGLESFHALFINEAEAVTFKHLGFLERASFQYHFPLQGMANFNVFLGKLKARKAKHIRKEREALSDLKIWRKTGPEISVEDGASFYPYYRTTIDEKEGIAYLNEDFFRLLAERMSDRLLIVGTDFAQSLFFFKGNRLYGRYWGSLQEREFLHFELCYYQGIEFGIERGMYIFEAGAQGEHKLLRGFVPVLIHSFHEVRNLGFRAALMPYLLDERRQVASYLEESAKALPYLSSQP